MKGKQTMEAFGLPSGRYEARVTETTLLEPARKHGWRIRINATVDRNGKEVLAFRDLAGDGADPYKLTSGRRKTLREFAARLGVQSEGPTEEIVAAILGIQGRRVTAHLRPGPMGMVVTLHQAEQLPDPVEGPLAGEVLDRVDPNQVEPAYREQTLTAQGAHEQLLAGLRHAHRGLALASQACWRLRQDEGWVALGYDSIGQYLASPEVAMAKSTFYGLADIWEQYVEEGGVDHTRLCAPSKLEVPLPAIKAGDVTAEEAIADAEVLGLRDLREKYRGDDDGGSSSGSSGSSSRVQFPFECPGCSLVVESPEAVNQAGVVYEGHRWPEGWSSEQVLAAVAAAKQLAPEPVAPPPGQTSLEEPVAA